MNKIGEQYWSGVGSWLSVFSFGSHAGCCDLTDVYPHIFEHTGQVCACARVSGGAAWLLAFTLNHQSSVGPVLFGHAEQSRHLGVGRSDSLSTSFFSPLVGMSMICWELIYFCMKMFHYEGAMVFASPVR